LGQHIAPVTQAVTAAGYLTRMPAAFPWLIIGALAGALGVLLLWHRERQQRTADLARIQAERDAAARSLDEQRLALASSQAQLRDAFDALSRSALRENRDEFLHHAGALFQPVRDTLDRVQAQLVEVDRHREGSYRAVTAQISSLTQAQEQLRAAADGLSRSLRSPNIRGRWGEVQLRRLVELAGMLEQCDFVEKATASSEEAGRQTPDLVVHLPNQLNIVVDAKVPIDAYLTAAAARSDAERQDLLAAHARQVRDHIRVLGGKEYWKQFQPSPEFVVMFLPLEPLLAAAFEQDATLLEQAASLRVIPATPMTLLALLRAIAYGWQQQQLAHNAEEIQLLGRDLYDRLATLVEHLESVGRNIKLAADSYDRFIGSLEQKVLPGARRFKDLGVTSTKDIDAPDQLRLVPRTVRRDELRESLTD
jgi:DNA recombination protein RmuC